MGFFICFWSVVFGFFLVLNAVKSCTVNEEVYITRYPRLRDLVLRVWNNLYNFSLSFQHYFLRVTLKCFFQREQIARYRFITTDYCGECLLVLGSDSIYPEAPYSSKSQDNPRHLLNVIN